MVDTTSIVAFDRQSDLIPTREEWSGIFAMCEMLVPTGFLPDSIKTPAQATAIVLKGRELRVPAMYALAHINVIKGKPSTDSELMLSLIHRDHGQRALRIKSSDDRQCTVEYRLTGWPAVQTHAFTIEQAKQAQLLTNPSWTKYPAAMLRARCISAVARMAFPASIGGMYVAGELGEEVSVTEDGEVISVSSTVDQETGEISSPPSPPRQLAAAPEYSDKDNHETAMRALHAEATEHGITHDQLHAWAVQQHDRPSLKDVPLRSLQIMRDRIHNNPTGSRDWFGQLVPDDQTAPDGVPVEELAEINQAIDQELAAQEPLVEAGGDKTPAAFR